MVIKEISPIDFLKRFLSYKKIIVIDIRSSSEYYQYHLKDSINQINYFYNNYVNWLKSGVSFIFWLEKIFYLM